mmetsp:Transcript_46356/g.145412  ORF Transcript_46356/g.145412 Transcript_46356/m.145412 type:complete len:363 (+) Transcript_46356:3589-4677(+)
MKRSLRFLNANALRLQMLLGSFLVWRLLQCEHGRRINDLIPFLNQRLVHSIAKVGNAYEVSAVSEGREVTAGNLVLPLRSCLHPLKPHADGGIDGLVVAKLKVQRVVLLATSPVPAIQAVSSNEVQRSRHQLSSLLLLRHHEQDLVCHFPSQQGEELSVQVSLPPFLIYRIEVELIERIPMPLLNLFSRQSLHPHPRLRHLVPLLPDALSPRLLQPHQELVETLVPFVPPVVLYPRPQQEPLPAHQLPVFLGGKCHMRTAQPVLTTQFHHPPSQRPPRSPCLLLRLAPRHQPRPHHRSERHAALQLRVVVVAGERPVCSSPGMVEHILPIAVALEVHRSASKDATAVLVMHNKVVGGPARSP